MNLNREEQLVRELLAPLDRVEPARLTSNRRHRRSALLVLSAAGALVLGGVAIASGVGRFAGIGPFAGIGAANHPATPNDAATPAVASQLKLDQPPSGPFDQIGARQIGSARAVGSVPSGRKVYVIATTKGKLCVVLEGSAESCGNPLTQSAPITFTIVDNEPQREPPIAYGVARDGVVSVSFTVSGREVEVPVRNNFFVYEGLRTDGVTSFSAPSVTFANGQTEVVQ